MSDYSNYNDTTKYLSHLIFKPSSMVALRTYGLENVFIDDYSHRCKYIDCLLFLVNPKFPVSSKTYEEFQDKLINFISFSDYYEIENKVMYVFKIPKDLIMDFHHFRLKNYKNLSDEFWQSLGARVPLDFSHVRFDVEKEVYRFNTNIVIKNELIKKGE